MCNLESEPWRAKFTGPNCRCGVPMPGTPEEQELMDKMEEAAKIVRQEEHKRNLAYYKQRRIDGMYGSLYLP